MSYLVTLAVVMFALGLVLARYSVNDAERFFARFMMGGAVIFAVIAFSIGCAAGEREKLHDCEGAVMAKGAMPVSKAKTAYGLLSEIRKLILAEPNRYFQGAWRLTKDNLTEDEKMPACGTIGCVAGWVDVLKSKRPLPANAAWERGIEFQRRGMEILGLSNSQAGRLFDGEAAGFRIRIGVVEHARRGAEHIARFQKRYAAQLKAKRV